MEYVPARYFEGFFFSLDMLKANGTGRGRTAFVICIVHREGNTFDRPMICIMLNFFDSVVY